MGEAEKLLLLDWKPPNSKCERNKSATRDTSYCLSNGSNLMDGLDLPQWEESERAVQGSLVFTPDGGVAQCDKRMPKSHRVPVG
jgi:hypothetical protein